VSADASAADTDVAWKVLVDLDAMPPAASVLHPEAFAKLSGARLKTFRASKKECTGKDDGVLTVDGGYQGAFTKKGANEVLFLVNLVPCATTAKPGPLHALLVVEGEGGHVNVKVNEPVTENDIAAVGDLDQDGDNEILLVGTNGASTTARLADTEDGKLETLFDFGEVVNGACEPGKPAPAGATSSVIRYRLVGSSMQYKAEKKPRACK
jgi:hypothetical protein